MTTGLAVGVIGCGHAAEMHVRAMLGVPRLRIDALFDVDAAASRRLAAAAGGAVAVEDPAVLVARPIDVVAVLTPPASHAALAAAALAAGKHVLIERPLACSAAEAADLAARARAAGRTVLMGYQLRHHRHVYALRSALAAGRFGRPQMLRTVMTTTHEGGRRFADYRRTRRLGGGTLLDFGVAHFDLWRFLLRDDVAEVTALSRADEGDDVTTSVVGRMRSGTLVASTFGYRAAEEHALELFGEDGRAAAALYRADGLRFAASGAFAGSAGRRLRDAATWLAALPQALAERRQGGVYLAAYGGLWAAVVRTLLDGVPAVATLDDGRRSLAVALAAMRSADEGGCMRLEPDETSR